jgi:hypothetical protein
LHGVVERSRNGWRFRGTSDEMDSIQQHGEKVFKMLPWLENVIYRKTACVKPHDNPKETSISQARQRGLTRQTSSRRVSQGH